METLYVIGNGFDLHHNLPTSNGHFHKYVSANNNDIENVFEEFFKFRTDDNTLWENFEHDLGTFDSDSFFDNNNHLDINDDNFRPSFTYALEDDLIEQVEQLNIDIRNAFEDWIESIKISGTRKKIELEKDAFFLSFNYTLTLEEVYKIQKDKIWHIHGDISNGELIFGHNKTISEKPELDENGDSNRTIFSNSESVAKTLFYNFQKPVESIIADNKNKFESFSEIKNIYVLGHSLNQIDNPYFKEINNCAKFAKWNVSYYRIAEKERHLSTLNRIGVAKKSIKLFRL